MKNLTLSLIKNFEAVIHKTKSNVSQIFEQLEIQLADTHEEIHLGIDTLTKKGKQVSNRH